MECSHSPARQAGSGTFQTKTNDPLEGKEEAEAVQAERG